MWKFGLWIFIIIKQDYLFYFLYLYTIYAIDMIKYKSLG